MTIQDFRGLKVWQASVELATEIYSLTKSFPKTEAFGLSSQLQRAAVSIPSNIAEGHARDSTKDFLRFISIALGSMAEVETQLIISRNLDYIDSDDLSKLTQATSEVGRMLRGLQHSLRAKLENSDPSL